jgi:hypothetical protein
VSRGLASNSQATQPTSAESVEAILDFSEPLRHQTCHPKSHPNGRLATCTRLLARSSAVSLPPLEYVDRAIAGSDGQAIKELVHEAMRFAHRHSSQCAAHPCGTHLRQGVAPQRPSIRARQPSIQRRNCRPLSARPINALAVMPVATLGNPAQLVVRPISLPVSGFACIESERSRSCT